MKWISTKDVSRVAKYPPTDLIKNGSISFWIEVGVRAPAVKHHLETLNTFQLSIVKKLRRSRRVVLPERKSSLRIS